MLLGGLQKATLVDYPGKVACTIFTVGCNFFCPFCHNKDLVSLKNFKQSSLSFIKEKDFFDFLLTRQQVLDGVCITGGEPTIQPDLAIFCQKIKNLDFLVKLDTNGGQPKIIKHLIEQKLIDFIALDVKVNKDNYYLLTNTSYQKIAHSLKIILSGSIDYQLRTTLVPKIHNEDNLLILAKELKSAAIENGVDPNSLSWQLQRFRPQNCLKKEFDKLSPFSDQEFERLVLAAQSVIPQVAA